MINLVYKGNTMQGGSAGVTIAIIVAVIVVIIIIAVVVVVVSQQTSSTPTPSGTSGTSGGSSSTPTPSGTSSTPTPTSTDYSSYYNKDSFRWCGGDASGDKISSYSTNDDATLQTALKACYENDQCYAVNQVNTGSTIDLQGLDGVYGNACSGSSNKDILWTKKGPFTDLDTAKGQYSSKNSGWCGNSDQMASGRSLADSDDSLLTAMNACYNDPDCYRVNRLKDSKGIILYNTSTKSYSSCDGSSGDYLYTKE